MNTTVGSVPHDRESVVAGVKREAAEKCGEEQPPPLILDRRLRDMADRRRDSRLTTFVSLLALRRVRAGTCDGNEW